ncbi:hypothetical protein ACTXIV_02855 [Psychrobacter celer]|uniref:hypothetical protein n=1 Tax=Psychrobacter celer TaxID=306572 RepID=UPI003FD4D33F
MSLLDIAITSFLALDPLIANSLILLPLLIVAIATVIWFTINLSDKNLKYDVKTPGASRKLLIISIASVVVLRLSFAIANAVGIMSLLLLAILFFYIRFTNLSAPYTYWPAILVITAILAIGPLAIRYLRQKQSLFYDELAKIDDKGLASNQSL